MPRKSSQPINKRPENVNVAEHMGLVGAVVNELQHRTDLPQEDLFQEGCIGLIRAAEHYDHTKANFGTYAMWWIRAAVREAILRNRSLVMLGKSQSQRNVYSRLHRVQKQFDSDTPYRERVKEIAKQAETSEFIVESTLAAMNVSSLDTPLTNDTNSRFVDLLEAEPGPDVDEVNRQEHYRRILRGLLGKLSKRQRFVLEQRYLGDEVRTFASLGKELGVSRERVRQIETEAMKRVRCRAKAAGFADELNSIWDEEQIGGARMITEQDKELIKLFRRKVRELNLPVREVAEHSGVSQSAIQGILKRNPERMWATTREGIQRFLVEYAPRIEPEKPTSQPQDDTGVFIYTFSVSTSESGAILEEYRFRRRLNEQEVELVGQVIVQRWARETKQQAFAVLDRIERVETVWTLETKK